MSIFDHPDSVPAVPTWRCPHCRQLQAETSHCWRCGRSAVTCSTCHRFRGAVADDVGYCAADPSRAPMTGDEVRSCWEGTPVAPVAPGLFDTPEPVTPAPMLQPRARERRVPPAAKPPVQEVRAAAWADASSGDLVDAPHVEAGRTVTSEVQRRRGRFWRR